MKKFLKTEIFSWLVIAITAVASIYFYRHFPEKVITHWNYAGVPDGWSSRAFGAFFFPALLLAIYLLFLWLPLFDPKKERYAEFAGVYSIFKNIIVFFLSLIYFIASLNNLGYAIDIGIFVSSAVGLLFVVIGNYFGKIKPNWFIGIRTPWTLSSEFVWNKTHRFGGKVFILGGLIMIFTGFAPLAWRLPLVVVDVVMLSLGTMVYSYFIYKKKKKNN
jgi:uncharacterized membrane protein